MAVLVVNESFANDQYLANWANRRSNSMNSEELAELQKLRKEHKKSKKSETKVVRALSCEPILVPSDFAVPYKSNSSCCKKNTVNYITQSSFSGNARNGILLDKPGVYTFNSNVNFNPTVERTTAITITTSNVVLDLDTFTLAQGNDVRYTYGIAIARDVENVTITGVHNQAVILDFSLAGVRVMGRTDSIVLENITTSQTSPIQLTNDDIPAECSEFLCTNLNMGFCIGEGETSSIAYQGTDRTNRVNNLSLKGVTAKKSVYGCQIVFAFGIEILDSSFNENTAAGLWLGNRWAILDEEEMPVIPTCSNGIIRNCHFDSNRGDNYDLSNPSDTYTFDFLCGIENSSTQNFIIEECTINDNYHRGYILAADHDGARNMVWRNCDFLRNHGELEPCEGFHFSGSIYNSYFGYCVGTTFPYQPDVNVVIEKCVSMDNSSGSVSCSGITFFGGVSVSCVDCHVSGNTSVRRAAGIQTTGGIPGAPSQSISIVRCTADGNNLVTPSQNQLSLSAGLWVLDTASDVVIRDFIGQSNGNTRANMAAGILIGTIFTSEDDAGPTSNVIIDNSVLNNNGNIEASFSGGIVAIRTNELSFDNILIQNNVLTYNNGVGVGVYGDMNNVVVKANESDNNMGTGFDVSQVPNPVLVAMNIAYGNGNGMPSGNYAGVNPLVIIEGTQNSLPTAVGAQNLSITVE